ncbi:MAG: hypothetical protein SGJ20_09315 [Planctomycetota bacterium]|nr:hypothetical protein [Planctomycetota bacterium]
MHWLLAFLTCLTRSLNWLLCADLSETTAEMATLTVGQQRPALHRTAGGPARVRFSICDGWMTLVRVMRECTCPAANKAQPPSQLIERGRPCLRIAFDYPRG